MRRESYTQQYGKIDRKGGSQYNEKEEWQMIKNNNKKGHCKLISMCLGIFIQISFKRFNCLSKKSSGKPLFSKTYILQ